MLQALEEMANTAATQSATFGQLAAEAVPKSLYCLSLRLAMKWASDADLREQVIKEQKQVATALVNTNLLHFCVFSDNVLGASVVVNSTIMNANHPEHLVFHLVTDAVNYGAMQSWFCLNDFKGAVIEIQTVESFTWLNASYVPVLKQLQDAETQNYYFRSTGQNAGEAQRTALKFRNPKYLSMLNHLRFYIPEVYPQLDKVIAILKSKQVSGSFCFVKFE
jgi:alpha-1,4-galacturonosyltransferase